MSLINQMLKDLEKRSPSRLETHSGSRSVYSLFKNKKRSFSYKKIILGVGFLSGLMILNGIYNILQTPPSIPQKANGPSRNNAIARSEESLSSMQHKAASALTGMTLHIQSNKTALRFLLSQTTLYRVDRIPSQDKLIIYLDHTHVLNDLPPLQYAKSGIKNIVLQNTDKGDLAIVISLEPGAELDFLQLNEAAKWPELQLNLTYHEGVRLGQGHQETIHAVSDEKQKGPVKKVVVSMTVHDDYQKALNYFAAGKPQEAIALLNRILQEYPRYSEAREALATILLQKGNKQAASRVLQAGITLEPKYLPFVQLQAELLVSEGKLNQALTVLHSLHPPLSQYPDYYSFIAALHQQLGHYAMASQLYEQLLSFHPNKAPWWVGLGIALEAQDKTQEAMQAFAKAKTGNELTPELRAFVEERTQSVG